ncbi:hypothetical protein Dimus_020538 [Dionaea muscipula]
MIHLRYEFPPPIIKRKRQIKIPARSLAGNCNCSFPPSIDHHPFNFIIIFLLAFSFFSVSFSELKQNPKVGRQKMQQRPAAVISSSRALSDDYLIIGGELPTQQQQQQQQAEHTPRRRAMAMDRDNKPYVIDLHPLTSFNPRRSPPLPTTWYGSPERLIHLIPLIVLLSCFILWWFSYPVTLVIKDGQITEINRIEPLPETLNKTLVELTILASATPSNASVPVSAPEILAADNAANSQPTSANG